MYPGAGTPSQYLARASLLDLNIDVAMAEHWRRERLRELDQALSPQLRKAGKHYEPRNEVLMRWLLNVMSSS